MADVVARDGAIPTIRALGVEPTQARRPVTDRRDARRSVCAPIGVIAHPDPVRVNIGSAPVVGRTDPSALRVIAAIAETTAARLRVTPWRGLVLLDVPASDADGVIAELARVGWSADPADRRHLVSACVGRAGCAATHADTIGAAESWIAAPAAGPGPIHFAGCDKRCGAGRVPVVVAASDGTFATGSS
jgi:precorrin-3B synthase